jgi:hypothetical protein
VHVLSTFSHASYPKAPELCLAKFDELHANSLDAFTKKHDPYWDIPLNEDLPQPVIDTPIPSEPMVREQEELFGGQGSGNASRRDRGPACRTTHPVPDRQGHLAARRALAHEATTSPTRVWAVLAITSTGTVSPAAMSPAGNTAVLN